MRRRSLLPLAVIALLAAACTESDLRIEIGDRSGRRPAPPAEDVLTDSDEIVRVALDDLERYWTDEIESIYDAEFTPLAGGYVAYGPNTPLPTCGDQPLSYEDVADNALYCPNEDLIAWDRVGLIPDLQRRFGPLTVGLVMAHEFAHAVQARGEVRGATVTLELQADCFAGAWVDDVDDRIPTFATDGDALDQAVAGLLELRDTLGVSGRDPAAHGSGFDRVSAFQDGFEGGTEVCVDYQETPPTVVAIPFGSLNDQISGGNMALERLIDPLVLDLESFFASLFDELGRSWDPIESYEPFDPADGPITCGREELSGDELDLASFYCASDDTLYIDGAGLVPELEEIGDFAFGGELARLYAFAAQEQLDLRTGDPVTQGLHADCITGVYAAEEFLQRIPDQQLVLSPGDLDEIIIAFLAFGDEAEASAFERTAAFRAGFVDGYEVCEDLLDQ